MGEGSIIESAARDAHAEASKKDLIRLDGKASWASQLKPDPDAAEAVEKWLRKRDLAMGSGWDTDHSRLLHLRRRRRDGRDRGIVAEAQYELR